jgi:hypothetical protein
VRASPSLCASHARAQAIPRLERGQALTLKSKDGGADDKLKADKAAVVFTVTAGDLARTEGAKADVELAYTHPSTGKPAVGILRDADDKVRTRARTLAARRGAVRSEVAMRRIVQASCPGCACVRVTCCRGGLLRRSASHASCVAL